MTPVRDARDADDIGYSPVPSPRTGANSFTQNRRHSLNIKEYGYTSNQKNPQYEKVRSRINTNNRAPRRSAAK